MTLGDLLLRMSEVCCCGKKLYTLYRYVIKVYISTIVHVVRKLEHA